VTPAGLRALSATDRSFVLEYDTNGNNGTRAYLTVFPGVKVTTAATEAWRLLRNPEIRAYLESVQTERFKRLQMSGDHALALTGQRANPDIRQAYDAEGKLLPVHLWPDSLVVCVKGIKPGPFGDSLVLVDPHAASRTVLEVTGKLKNPGAALGATLAELLTGTPAPDSD
jgi:hypothetical protein